MHLEKQASTAIDQAGAVPYRRNGKSLEFCLITSSGSGRWGFPKGVIDPGETVEQTALKESLEEAGLHGRIIGEPIGSYRYEKWETTLTVLVLLMEVDSCDKQWDESDIRERCWVTAEKARELLCRPRLLKLLEAAVERLEGKAPSNN